MDKYEYRLKREKIKTLVSVGDYKAAARVADSVNWSKVRNVDLLCKVADIYEKVGRPEDSKEILLLAYEKSPIGKRIMFRLAMLAIRMNNLEGAEEYYQEFLDIAPHDSQKYVLRYKLHRAQNKDITLQIEDLEDLKEQEFTEEWGYELARLYHQAHMTAKCIALCDELSLWFGDGAYVEKALKLKMKYQPLSHEQAAKLRQMQKEHGDEKPDEQETDVSLQRDDETQKKIQAALEYAQDLQRVAKEHSQEKEQRELEDEEQSNEVDIPLSVDIPLPGAEEQSNVIREVDDEKLERLNLKQNLKENLHQIHETARQEEKAKRQFAKTETPLRVVKPKSKTVVKQDGYDRIQQVLEDWEKTRQEAAQNLKESEERRLHEAKEKAIREAADIMDQLMGVLPQEELAQFHDKLKNSRDLTAQEAGRLVAELNQTLQQKIDQISLFEKEKKKQMEASVIDIPSVDPIKISDIVIPSIEVPDIKLEQMEISDSEEPQQEDIEKKEQVAGLDQQEAAELQRAEAELEQELKAADQELEEEALQQAQEELKEELQQADERQIRAKEPEEDTLYTEDLEPTRPLPDLRSILKRTKEEIVRNVENAWEHRQEANPKEEWLDELEGEWSEDAPPSAPFSEIQKDDPGQTGDAPQDAEEEETDESQEQAFTEEETQTEEAGGEFENGMEGKTKQEHMTAEIEEQTKTEKGWVSGATRLPQSVRGIFSYFIPVTGMEVQLCRTIDSVLEHRSNSVTSTTGNILIQGIHGSGKTVLAANLIKALQKLDQDDRRKVGKIDADALNQKDIASILQRVAGGYLIIERAENLSRETAGRLGLLMEGDTNGLVVILEDTRAGIRKALSQDANFAAKFTERIDIPYFTSDELVAFGRAYARDMGYRIDEMGILALYNRISSIQKLDQATTLTEIKEIVDHAIAQSEKGGWKKLVGFFSGRKDGADDYILLHEKDFENID